MDVSKRATPSNNNDRLNRALLESSQWNHHPSSKSSSRREESMTCNSFRTLSTIDSDSHGSFHEEYSRTSNATPLSRINGVPRPTKKQLIQADELLLYGECFLRDDFSTWSDATLSDSSYRRTLPSSQLQLSRSNDSIDPPSTKSEYKHFHAVAQIEEAQEQKSLRESRRTRRDEIPDLESFSHSSRGSIRRTQRDPPADSTRGNKIQRSYKDEISQECMSILLEERRRSHRGDILRNSVSYPLTDARRTQQDEIFRKGRPRQIVKIPDQVSLSDSCRTSRKTHQKTTLQQDLYNLSRESRQTHQKEQGQRYLSDSRNENEPTRHDTTRQRTNSDAEQMSIEVFKVGNDQEETPSYLCSVYQPSQTYCSDDVSALHMDESVVQISPCMQMTTDFADFTSLELLVANLEDALYRAKQALANHAEMEQPSPVPAGKAVLRRKSSTTSQASSKKGFLGLFRTKLLQNDQDSPMSVEACLKNLTRCFVKEAPSNNMTMNTNDTSLEELLSKCFVKEPAPRSKNTNKIPLVIRCEHYEQIEI